MDYSFGWPFDLKTVTHTGLCTGRCPRYKRANKHHLSVLG